MTSGAWPEQGMATCKSTVCSALLISAESPAAETRPENRALANGVFLGFNFIIQSTATVILGMLGDRFGLRTAYVFAAIIPLMGLPLVTLLPNGYRRAAA
jgi:MFS family permease